MTQFSYSYSNVFIHVFQPVLSFTQNQVYDLFRDKCAATHCGAQLSKIHMNTATRTWDLPVTDGKTLPLAPGPPFICYLIFPLMLPHLASWPRVHGKIEQKHIQYKIYSLLCLGVSKYNIKCMFRSQISHIRYR